MEIFNKVLLLRYVGFLTLRSRHSISRAIVLANFVNAMEDATDFSGLGINLIENCCRDPPLFKPYLLYQ